MVTMEMAPEATRAGIGPAILDSDELFKWQLRVARRADALVRDAARATRETDRRVWLRAELETYENWPGGLSR